MEYEASDDGGLVELANQGHAKAFEALYRRHREWVVALAWRFLGSRDDALDIMQEVFAHLFNRFPGFVLTSTMRAFLYPIVKHQCISLIRKQRKIVPISREARSAETLAWHPEPPGDFARIIGSLSPEHQEVVKLRFGLGMQLDEIGEALDIPLGTVKSRLHNSLKLLRKYHSEKKIKKP